MENEIWIPVKGYESQYHVSQLGRVKKLAFLKENGVIKESKILKQSIQTNGYPVVCLDKKQFTVHRLVAGEFNNNPFDFPCINHKDEDKTNNHYSNLEWCTHKYNINYSERPTKEVFQYSLEGNLINKFNSITEASLTGFHASAISYCCNKLRKTHGGYIWSFTDDNKD